jgi:glutamate synthase domain-containing protein 2
MSFGSLSGPAVESMNRGAALAGCLQNTGEGGLSRHHKHGGELILQIGSGYFGCRDEEGRFSLAELERQIEIAPIRALEIKLSQGAKPGLGGLLPAAKVTDGIAEAREVSADEDCVSPSRHSAFGNVDEMLDFVEMLGERDGPARRDQVGGGRGRVLDPAREPDGDHGPRRRLHHDRRR